MNFEKLVPLEFLHNADYLRKIIIENPDLPVCFIANEEDCIDGGMNTLMNTAYINIEKVFSAHLPFTDYDDFTKLYDDKIEFEEDLQDYFTDYNFDGCNKMDEKTFNEWFDKQLKSLEPYWKDVIMIRVSNS